MSNINPRVDIAFKKIFGVEENKDLLISLINSIVGVQDQVSDIILLNPYNQESLSTCCAISLPKALLKEIDEMRIWNKQSSRSSWVVTAIKERVEREKD